MTNERQNNERENRKLDERSMDLIDTFLSGQRFASFPFRVARVNVSTKVGDYDVENFKAINTLNLEDQNNPNCFMPLGDVKELFKMAARDYTRSRLLKKITIANPYIDFEWNGYEVSQKPKSFVTITTDDFVLQNGKAYPNSLYVYSKSRARAEFERGLEDIHKQLKESVGTTIGYIPNGVSAKIKPKEKAVWAHDLKLVFCDYPERDKSSQEVRQSLNVWGQAIHPFGNICYDFVLPDGSSLSRDRMVQYHRQKAEQYAGSVK